MNDSSLIYVLENTGDLTQAEWSTVEGAVVSENVLNADLSQMTYLFDYAVGARFFRVKVFKE